MTTPHTDPLALRDEPTERLVVTVPRTTLLALYHYCLRSGTDQTKIPLAAGRILSAFLDRDTAFKRWCHEHRDTLPTDLPDRGSKRPADHA